MTIDEFANLVLDGIHVSEHIRILEAKLRRVSIDAEVKK